MNDGFDWEIVIAESHYASAVDQVRRLPVPGGWLYQTWRRCRSEWSDTVFVPTPRTP